MTRIDRYILFLFLRVIVICFCCLIGLLVVVHAFTNLDEFIAFGKARGSMLRALGEYYGPYSIALLDKFGAMLALMAIMFVVSWLKRTNELTSMMAAGISPRRILIYPIIASGIFFAALAVNRELIIPRYEEMLGKNPQDLSEGHLRSVKPTYDGKNGVLIGGRSLSIANRMIVEPIFRMDGYASAAAKQVIAKEAYYQDATDTHPSGFLMVAVSVPVNLSNIPSVRDVDPSAINSSAANPSTSSVAPSRAVTNDNDFVFLTPKENPWLQPDQCFIKTDIEFGELRGGSGWKQYASTLDMIERLRSPASHYGDDLRVTVHSRFVQPIMDMTLLMIGLPIVLKRQDRHLFYIAGVTLATVGGFMAITMGIQAAAGAGLWISPFFGAWLPVLLFAPWAWAQARVSLDA
ncbi:MAG: LptF/LptG family permease [Planctomycetota bacterium]|nr:LptF/LptG family permease [Planctomycetota bacterium]